MKALLYKEFKLAMHPICYIFIALFPLMILIPQYPLFVGFIYVLSCYPILFLGANKGQQSNDLLFSTLLPVRKKDIVLARIITVIFMQVAFMVIMSCLFPLAYIINQGIIDDKTGLPVEGIGFGLTSYVLVLAIALVGYAIADLIFFPIYYKHGKSIVASTLCTILGFIVYLTFFTIALPYIIGIEKANSISLWIQFIVLGGAIVLSALIHVLVYKVGSKELEKVDF
ncbi:MAG: ABC-2 transporter permease [Bacilli bacterium]|nr:ABC-2 transporter permease [Bacilli bacterium]